MGRRLNTWAKDHDRCRACGTMDRPHRSKGLCGHCYNQMILYLMKRYRIPRRSNSEARRNAQRDGKVFSTPTAV